MLLPFLSVASQEKYIDGEVQEREAGEGKSGEEGAGPMGSHQAAEAEANLKGPGSKFGQQRAEAAQKASGQGGGQ